MIRKAKKSDLNAIIALYKKVAELKDGIARTAEEITFDYVDNFLSSALNSGLIFVAEDSGQNLIAEIHCYKFGPKCFDNTLSNLTLVVDQDFHGQKIGFKIFSKLLDEVKLNPKIARVELSARKSNQKAITLYQKLGFEIEGYMKNRLISSSGKSEDDVMMAWINPNFK
jgi:ribosomal protein S18 acetylase RimI-like enzyme